MFFQRLLENPLIFLIGLMSVIIALTVHEFAHAMIATFYGDDTAKAQGRLSLNPLRHLDPMGFMMMLFAGFGWARPVPVNQFNLRSPKWHMMLVAAAGPGINILMALVCVLLIRILDDYLAGTNLLLSFLFLLAMVNGLFAVFNFLPIPPLDGSRVLFGLLPDRFMEFKEKYTLYGPAILIGLIIIDSFSNLSIFQLILGWIPNFLIYLITI